jgi:hypothetical protein
MKHGGKLITTEDKSGEDMKGKFGRILGDFKVEYNGEMKRVTEIMEAEGHCVPYFGGSKEDTQAAHEVNRIRLLAEGIVTQEAYDKAVKKMEKKRRK